jgi:hypothetical protein
VKRSITILLLLHYLLAFVAPRYWVDQFLHLPDLIVHFQEHKLQDAKIGVIEFLEEHYGQKSHTENHDHHQLPFKSSCHDHSNPIVEIFISPEISIQIQGIEKISQVFSTQKIVVSPQNKYSRNAVNNIFQPPRLG